MVQHDLPPPSTHELVKLHTDILLAGAALSERIKLDRKPVNRTVFYIVSDPRRVDNVALPTLLSDFNLRSIIIGYDTIHDDNVPPTNHPSFVYDLAEGEAHVDMETVNEGDHPINYVAQKSQEKPETLYAGTSDAELVQTTARLIRPYADPSLLNHADLSDPELVEDIHTMLSQQEFAMSTSIAVYEIDDTEITVCEEDGRLVELSLTKKLMIDDSSIAIRLSYDGTRYEIKNFFIENDQREQIPADELEILAFKDIIDELLRQLDEERATNIPEVSHEQLADEELEEEI